MSETIKLSFDDGYKNIEINGDPDKIIRINPTDAAFIKRIAGLKDKAAELTEKYGDIDLDSIEQLKDIKADDPDFEKLKKAADNIDRLDRSIRELIDSAFESPVCNTVFGEAWCISPAGGAPVYMNFLEDVGNYIGAEIAEQNKESAKRISGYTDRAKSIKPNRQRRRAAAKRKKKAGNDPSKPNKPDVSALSAAERKALLAELIEL